MPHRRLHTGNEREGRQRRALTGCLLAIGLVAVVGMTAFAYMVVADAMDGPRNMDASELDALIGGTTIIEEPRVECPRDESQSATAAQSRGSALEPLGPPSRSSPRTLRARASR